MEQKQKKVRLGFREIKSCSWFLWVVIPTLACPWKDVWNTVLGRGVSKIEEGRNLQGCVEVTVGYCSHRGSWKNHICILKSQKYRREQLLNPVPVASWTGPLSWGEAEQALLGTCDPYREAQRSVCSVLSLLWKSLRKVTGLGLGGVRTASC